MREILFRGKRIDNGEWIEGKNILILDTGRTFIIQTGTNVHCLIFPAIGEVNPQFLQAFYFEVDPETVGQFTGLNDKKIFERVIIRANHDGAIGVVRFGEYMSPSDPDLTRHIGYYVDWQGKEKDFLRADLGYWASRSDVEVIGNIHDNPELLEVQAERKET